MLYSDNSHASMTVQKTNHLQHLASETLHVSTTDLGPTVQAACMASLVVCSSSKPPTKQQGSSLRTCRTYSVHAVFEVLLVFDPVATLLVR
jgi:hypothetical protein